MCNRYLRILVLFGVCSSFLLSCSCRTKNNSEEQVKKGLSLLGDEEREAIQIVAEINKFVWMELV